MSRVSVIGTGKWGRVLIDKFLQLGVLHLVYGHANRTSLRYLAEKFTDDLNFLIQDSDAVVIATPPMSHFSLAKRILSEGKDVFIEKPMALSSKEAEQLVLLARRTGAIVMVGHQLCYSDGYKKLKQLPGKPIYSKARFFKKVSDQKTINSVWHLGVHMVAMAVSLGIPKNKFVLETSDNADFDERIFELHTRDSNGVEHTFVSDFLASKNTDDMLMRECSAFLNALKSRIQPLTDAIHGLETIYVLESIGPNFKR
jgi:predicted dehydrogenase